ncbi:MAG: glycosyltransferase family 1 protein [Deltaproteobacteria bacterium HGW-Deltaproteobacteria-4]|nr:MAG: glycosyltransferase family 1 protein [Deltaproteobacteria bacterium HGW-Deltaproteobacteria-4]
MKKVLFVSTMAYTLDAFLLPYAYHFRNKGWQVDAAASNASNHNACREAFNHIWDINWSRNPFDFKNLHRASQEIQTLITREGYDLVHVHTPIASFITRFAMRSRQQSRRPVIIYTAHGFHFHKGGRMISNGLFLNLEKVAGRWTDYLVTINKEDYSAAGKHRIVSPERLKYIPGVGVDLKTYSPESMTKSDIALFRNNMGIDERDWLFLVIGELNRNKRPDLVIDAFAALPTKKAHLVFLGEGYLRSRLRAQGERLNVLDRTHFLGFRSDVTTLLEVADSLILASQREGLPRSIMEALCLERPCIGSDVRGTRDLLADGCGLIFKTNDQQSLTQTMSWMIEHPEETKSMGKHGRQIMVNYDINHILKLHEELYEEALAGH